MLEHIEFDELISTPISMDGGGFWVERDCGVVEFDQISSMMVGKNLRNLEIGQANMGLYITRITF